MLKNETMQRYFEDVRKFLKNPFEQSINHDDQLSMATRGI